MTYVEIALFVIGLVALVVGYRRNRRNVLLAAAIVLFLSGTVSEFATGFAHGWERGYAANRGSAATK